MKSSAAVLAALVCLAACSWASATRPIQMEGEVVAPTVGTPAIAGVWKGTQIIRKPPGGQAPMEADMYGIIAPYGKSTFEWRAKGTDVLITTESYPEKLINATTGTVLLVGTAHDPAGQKVWSGVMCASSTPSASGDVIEGFGNYGGVENCPVDAASADFVSTLHRVKI